MTEGYHVSYAPKAYHDLGDIFSYLAFTLHEKQTASNLIKRIQREIASLNTFPERYAQVDWEPWASMGVRKLPVGNYIVFYQVDLRKKTVTIIRIFYGGRNVEDIINEGKD